MASLDDGLEATSQINLFLSRISFAPCLIAAEGQSRTEQRAPGEATEHAPFATRLLQ